MLLCLPTLVLPHSCTILIEPCEQFTPHPKHGIFLNKNWERQACRLTLSAILDITHHHCLCERHSTIKEKESIIVCFRCSCQFSLQLSRNFCCIAFASGLRSHPRWSNSRQVVKWLFAYPLWWLPWLASPCFYVFSQKGRPKQDRSSRIGWLLYLYVSFMHTQQCSFKVSLSFQLPVHANSLVLRRDRIGLWWLSWSEGTEFSTTNQVPQGQRRDT